MSEIEEIEQRYLTILTEFGRNIKRFCIVHSENCNDADDLMQEIFAAIWKGIPTLAPDSSGRRVNVWLYKLMLSVYFKKLRHRQYWRLMPDELLPEIPAQDNDDRETLDELLSFLSSDERALVDDIMQGYSVTEMASRHSLSISAASARLSRIRTKLKTIKDQLYG